MTQHSYFPSFLRANNKFLALLLCIYDSFFWLDEFDPKFLHLGRGREDFSKVNAAKVHVHLREFDDGRFRLADGGSLVNYAFSSDWNILKPLIIALLRGEGHK